MRTLGRWIGLGALVVNLAACGAVTSGPADDEENVMDPGKYEAWNEANNPAYVDSSFVYEVDQLPVEGKTARDPWPGDYWATARDSINYRWDGDNPSPAEKAEQALSLPGFAGAVTNNFGIYGQGRPSCTTSSDCSSLNDGSSCVFPRGQSGANAGRCIPGWWGICHGWTPAALSEPAPQKPVTRNGVTFYPGDLEGLMSLVYSRNLPTKFLSERCNKDHVRLDNTGRPVDGDSECRDTNPGTLHVVLTNFLGLRHTGLAEDRIYNLEVWNQPIRSFKVTNAQNGKLQEISKADAVAMLGLANLRFSDLLAATDVKKDEQKSGVYTATVAGEVVIKMAGAGDADLYVRKGAAPDANTYDCRPYTGTSNEECRVSVAVGDKLYWMVTGYAATSTGVSVQAGVPEGTPNYVYNTAAQRFFYVELDLDYITEAAPAHTVADADSYTSTDHYQYILETDANGRILGGEWVGDSRALHPDFLWWPNGKPEGTLPGGLDYAMVKSLNDEAAGVGGGPTTSTLLDNVALGTTSKYVTVGVPGGAKLTVEMRGTGNADLYVRLGAKPSVNVYSAKSTGPTSTESVTLTAPPAGGTYYVRARPVSGSPTVTVTATIAN